jgi:hypothetical protein
MKFIIIRLIVLGHIVRQIYLNNIDLIFSNKKINSKRKQFRKLLLLWLLY